MSPAYRCWEWRRVDDLSTPQWNYRQDVILHIKTGKTSNYRLDITWTGLCLNRLVWIYIVSEWISLGQMSCYFFFIFSAALEKAALRLKGFQVVLIWEPPYITKPTSFHSILNRIIFSVFVEGWLYSSVCRLSLSAFGIELIDAFY